MKHISLKKAFSLSLTLLLAVLSLFCSGCSVKKTDETTQPQAQTTVPEETTTEPTTEYEGDPTYGLFEEGYGWETYSAYTPEYSYCVADNKLLKIENDKTSVVNTDVKQINGITSKAIFVTTTAGNLFALNHDGSEIRSIRSNILDGAALNPQELTIYYAKGAEPITVYAFDLVASDEASVFEDIRLCTQPYNTEQAFYYAFTSTLTYNRTDNTIDLYFGYPWGSEFPYERHLTISDGKVIKDDHDTVQSDDTPVTTVEEEVLLSVSGYDYVYTESSQNGGYLGSSLIAVNKADGTKTALTSSKIISSATAGSRLFYIAYADDGTTNLYMVVGGELEWNLVKKTTVISELFSWENKLYGSAIDAGYYEIYSLSEEGKYIDTVFQSAQGTTVDEYDTKYCLRNAAGKYLVLWECGYSTENYLERLIGIYDMQAMTEVK